MILNQLQLLPVAYFIILMWVVSATVLARLFGPLLVGASPERLQRFLSRRVGMTVTGDVIAVHLFEENLLCDLARRISLSLSRRLRKLPGNSTLIPAPVPTFVLQKVLVTEQYWSGCPPNRA